MIWRSRKIIRIIKSHQYDLAYTIYLRIPIPKRIKWELVSSVKWLFGEGAINYKKWVFLHDTLSDFDRRAIREQIGMWDRPPVISIIVPVYNSSEKHLRKTIESVRRQLYPFWELYLSDASCISSISEILKEYSDCDSRIKFKSHDRKVSITEISNSAVELANGQFVAFLGQEDELAEHALYWVVSEVISHPETQLIFTDEDKIDEMGNRLQPHFKPDWNSELMLCNNAVSHLSVYYRERVLAIGGFRKDVEGAHDWDLVLRFSENLDPKLIRHIPSVLYHKRIYSPSTESFHLDKASVLRAQKKSVGEHLGRLGDMAELNETVDGDNLLPYFFVKNSPLVSIIIPTKDHVRELKACIDSLNKTMYENYEIVVIDNQSVEAKTLSYLRELEAECRTRVLHYNHPFNFSAMHNWAVPQTEGDYLCLLNNDTEVIEPGWLNSLLALAQRPNVGVVGAKLLYPDDTVQHAGVITGIGGIAGHAHRFKPRASRGYFSRAATLQNFSIVTGACMLVSKENWYSVQGMTENLGVSCNDFDFCMKLLDRGLRNIWSPTALLYHYESKSRGPDTVPDKLRRVALERAYIQWRWGDRLFYDPAYNPNLTLDAEDFSLSSSPRRLRPWMNDYLRVDVPYGTPLQQKLPLYIKPDQTIVGVFRLSPGLRGRLCGLALLFRVKAGHSHGVGVLTVKVVDDDGQEALGHMPIDEWIIDDELTQVLFTGDGLFLRGQSRLRYEITWIGADGPITLWGYTLDDRWSHKVENKPMWAARIQLLVSP